MRRVEEAKVHRKTCPGRKKNCREARKEARELHRATDEGRAFHRGITVQKKKINDVHCSTKGTAGNDRSLRSGSNVCATVQVASLAVAVVLVYCTASTSGK